MSKYVKISWTTIIIIIENGVFFMIKSEKKILGRSNKNISRAKSTCLVSKLSVAPNRVSKE